MQSSISGGSSNQQSDSSSGERFLPWQEQNAKDMLGLLKGQLSGLGNIPSFESAYKSVGGNLTPFPDVKIGPIWTDPQIQERVNQMRSRNDAALGGQQARLSEEAAGRGFGSRSPLYMALSTNLQGLNMSGNAAAENDLRWNAAQGNAENILKGTELGVNRANYMNQAEAQRRAITANYLGTMQQAAAQRYNAILQAMNAYNRPLSFSESHSTGHSGNIASSYADNDSNWIPRLPGSMF